MVGRLPLEDLAVARPIEQLRAPEVGYDKCSDLAKQAHKEGKTIKQLVGELELMPAERLEELMDYDAMTRPG